MRFVSAILTLKLSQIQSQATMNLITRLTLVAIVTTAIILPSSMMVQAAQPASIQEKRAEFRQRMLQARAHKAAAFDRKEAEFFNRDRRR